MIYCAESPQTHTRPLSPINLFLIFAPSGGSSNHPSVASSDKPSIQPSVTPLDEPSIKPSVVPSDDPSK